MSVNQETLDLQYALTLRVNGIVDASTRVLVARWSVAWREIAAEWEAAVADIAAARADGQTLRRGQILRLERAQRALGVTADKLTDLAGDLNVVLSGPARSIVEATAAQTRAIIASQMPSGVSVDLARVDADAMDAMVERSTEQITALGVPLSDDAYAAVEAALIRAVPSGWSPQQTAREILFRTMGEFYGGLARALTIARTELLDIHRAANRASERANRDVMEGWIWLCALDPRSCPGCVAMHGSEHDTDEFGPKGHQNCRCARVPKTKPWRDLGFQMDEPESLITPAEDMFWGRDDLGQDALVGKTRADLLRSGDITWNDLTLTKTSDGWRDSIVPAPLKTLRRNA